MNDFLIFIEKEKFQEDQRSIFLARLLKLRYSLLKIITISLYLFSQFAITWLKIQRFLDTLRFLQCFNVYFSNFYLKQNFQLLLEELCWLAYLLTRQELNLQLARTFTIFHLRNLENVSFKA